MKTSTFFHFLTPTLSIAAFTLLVSASAQAEPSAGAVATTANINLVSQYRFRGIDQTWGSAAVQGGFDAILPNGLYGGLWASNVSGRSYAGGSLELDIYGGYNGKVNDDLSYTAGVYGYVYPGANTNNTACPSAAAAAPCSLPSQKFDTLEFNAGATYKWIAYKLSVSATDYFGANPRTGYSGHTHGSMYHDLTATWPLSSGLALSGHVGFTDMKASYGTINPDYVDYRLALAKTFTKGWNLSVAVVGASNKSFYQPPVGGLSASNGDTRNLARDVVTLQVGRIF